MSKTLNLVESLLCRARICHDLGLHDRAKDLFERLAAFRSLPAEVAEETQVRLADLAAAESDSLKERQHLTRAVVQQPNNAEYHFRLARAYSRDDETDKAIVHFKSALRIDAENPRCLVELGSLFVDNGQFEQGLRLLKKAYKIAEDDLDVVEAYANGLSDAGQPEEAKTLLKTAMFRHSNDRRFRDLYRDFQFRATADDQQRKASIPFSEEEPVILPFRSAAPRPRRFTIDGQIVRIDGAEPLHGPTRRTPSRKKHSR